MTAADLNPRWVRRIRSTESTSRRGLFERSEFPCYLIRDGGGGTRKGCARAEKVLGPFAETKGPRLQGRNPAYNKTLPDLINKSLKLNRGEGEGGEPGFPLTTAGMTGFDWGGNELGFF